MSTLPVEAKIFDALGLGDQVRWTIDRELATSQLELLDVIARKYTKVKKPLINTRIRPADRQAAKPVSMSDPKARTFFGGRVEYTPRDKPATPAEPVYLGGGWYQLPDGSKVQGRDKLKGDGAGP